MTVPDDTYKREEKLREGKKREDKQKPSGCKLK
jgi:hypothetical protein